MDRNNNRDIVYCHECENEWYRDEHGLECPECHSDFIEIVEPDHDPRQDEQHIPADTQALGEFNAPDPDEDDIDNLQWEQTGPDRYRIHGTYRTTMPAGGQQGQGQGQQGGLMGMVGGILQNYLGAQQQGQQQRRLEGEQQRGANTPGRPASAPGSPPPDDQQSGGNGTFIRHGSGPGFSYTIASTSRGNIGGFGFGSGSGPPNLLPRNANGPQPYQNQPDHIEQMLNQMIMNIGAGPGSPMGAGGMRMGPGGHPFHDHDMHPGGFGGGPFMMGGGGGGAGQMPPIAHLFNLFGGGGGPPGAMGDAVYSQEALDRIITQLMEQHQAGNAPGPASEAAIKALPTKQISAADQGENGKAECSICMDEVALGGTVSVLPCQHWFHHECIKAWLSEHDTCPHCRQGIMSKDSRGEGSAQPRAPTQEPLHDMRSPEYTRPAVPGAYPFPRQNSGGGGDGSMQNPYQVPDSPNLNRRNSTGDRRRSSGGGSVFSRMRDAFSGGGSGSASGSGNRG